MAFLHRLLFGELPCSPQSSCNCTCVTPPPPPVGAGNSPPPHHLHLPTSLTVMACTLGVFFFLGIVCTVARLYYLKRIESRRRNQAVLFDTQDDFADEERGPAVHHPIWLINFVGLQQSVIDSITVCKYKRGDGLIEDTECTVCLTEFEEDENVRLLPKCSHAFHLPCIDTWLRSHKTCPLCRAPVAGQQEPQLETQIGGSGTEIEVDHDSQVDEDGSGAETDLGFGCRALSDVADDRRLAGVKPMRRSVSMGSNSASMIGLAVANAGKRNGNWEAKLKRQTFKNSGDKGGGGAYRGSSSLHKLMRSASSGRVSMMRRSYTSASSRNCRSQDSILPLSSA